MRWSALAIALLLAVVLQTLLWYLGLRSLNLFLMLALLCGLHAPTHDARIAAWMAGFVQDLLSDGPLGLNALSLGLTGLLLTAIRDAGFSGPGARRLIAAFLGAWPGQILVGVWLHFWTVGGSRSVWRVLGGAAWDSLWPVLLAGAITAIPWLFPRRRRRMRAAERYAR